MSCHQCPHCAALPPKVATRGPKLPAPGSRGHERCVHHEPIALPELRTPVLCFDARPTKADIASRIAFAKGIATAIAKHRKAYAARPTPDGRIAMADGKRLAPHLFPAWLATRKGSERVANGIVANPKPSRKRPDPHPFASRFTGKRGVHRRRKGTVAA